MQTSVAGGGLDAQLVAAEARRVLGQIRQTGVSKWGGSAYDFVCPPSATYPFQWLWDSAFHAIALLHVDPELAKQELRCLLQAAQPEGFISHMVLWEQGFHNVAQNEYSIVLADPYYTATLQPPVLAHAIWREYQATRDAVFLADVLPTTLRFFRWLATHRDPDGDHLIAIIQPDESGLDASPKYDVLMQLEGVPAEEVLPRLRQSMQHLFSAYAPHRADPARLPSLDVFNWEDVMVNPVYADGLGLLGDLPPSGLRAERSNRVRAARAPGAHRAQRKVLGQPRRSLRDLFGTDEQRARTLTFSSLFPLVLDSLDRGIAQRLVVILGDV